MKIERIILTTDFSPCSRAAAVAAAGLACRYRATTSLVHVLEGVHDSVVIRDKLSQVAFRDQQRRSFRDLAKEAAELRPVFGEAELETHLVVGKGPDAICQHVEETGAGMIVIASHGHSGFKHFFLGSFAERLIRRSPVPTLVVKSRAGEAGGGEEEVFFPKRVLFPSDFSPFSLHALYGMRILDGAYDISIRLRHFRRAAAHPPRGDGGDVHSALLSKLEALASREFHDRECDCRVLDGDPASLIVAEAQSGDVDVICMATHGRSGFTHALLGSVAEKVVRRAPCPVLTVRPREVKSYVSTNHIVDPETFLAGWGDHVDES